MQSTSVDVFFSCSFRDEDKIVNEYFMSICSALDIKCTNVDGAHTSVPPDVARRMIDNSQALIAVATRRNKLETGEYAMPPAVQEEVSMAYAKELPILLFAEDGVAIDGMKKGYGTFMAFQRDKLSDNESLEKIVRSIHGLKLETISPNDLIFDHDTSAVVADNVKLLIELRKTDSGYIWSYASSKRLRFLSSFRRSIPVVYWATVPTRMPDNEKPIKMEIQLDGHSRDLSLKVENIKQTPDCVKSLLRIDPHPEKGDYIEYTSYAESKYFNPLFQEDIAENTSVTVDGDLYRCIDGFIPIQRTKIAVLEIRFPRGYGLSKNSIRFFVGSYTDEVDYLVESEMARAQIEMTEIGGYLTVKIQIESPLLRHLYGFAWNPPHKTSLQTK